MAGGCVSCIGFFRFILLVTNVIFVIVGAGLIGIGVYLKVDNNFSAVLGELTHDDSIEGKSLGFLAFVLIGGGIVTMLVALFGIMASLRSSRCVLYTYTIILTTLMILEFAGLIVAFAYKSKLEATYKNSLTTLFTKAIDKNDTKVLDAFHKLENSMKCCGANGPTDYNRYPGGAPAECYKHPKGCSVAIIDWLHKNLAIIEGSLGAILIVELFSLIISLALAIALKNAPEKTYSSTPGEVISYVVPGRRRNYNPVP